MLNSEIIFEYVWRHFISIYPEAKSLKVNYGKLEGGKVSVFNGSLAFFSKKLPFPEQLFWRNFEDKNLPFLTAENSPELFREESGQFIVTADIIGSAFYFLSGWQEYYSEVRDKFNRFPYQESLQFKHGFVTLPVVNYYFKILRKALEKGYGISLKNSRANSFTTFLSHDLDRLESAWKVAGLQQLKKGDLGNFLNLGWQKLQGRDHWHNVKTVAKTVKKLNAVSTFFWLAEKEKWQGHPNADYAVSDPEYQHLQQFLAEAGFENGIHGSFGSSENSGQLNREMEQIQGRIKGNRFHYLCFDPKKTPEILALSGLHYDSTLGFAEHFGFRNSYCFPFQLFDFLNLKPYPFLEIPLNLMDATLWHPNYLQIAPENVVKTIKPMLLEIQKFGGVFGLLWHNENFSTLNTQNGLAVFEKLMLELNQLHATFRTGHQIWAEFSEKLRVSKR